MTPEERERQRLETPGELSRWTLDRLERERHESLDFRIRTKTALANWQIPRERVWHLLPNGQRYYEAEPHHVCSYTFPLALSRADHARLADCGMRRIAFRITLEPLE